MYKCIKFKKYLNIYIVYYIMSKICVRCGREYTRLKQHLQSKNICSATYLDVNRDEIITNYDILFSKFVKIKKSGGNKKHCSICNKQIMSKNMARHNKIVHKENTTINGDQINGDQINGDQINGDQININHFHININLNSFGDEDNIKLADALNIYHKYYNNQKDLKDVSALINYIEKLHMQISENMNVYRDKKNKYAYCYIDGKWKHIRPGELLEMLAKNTSKHISTSLAELDLADKNKSIIVKNGEDKKIIDISKYVKSGIELNKYIKTMIEKGNNEDSIFTEDWKEFSELLDMLFLDYKEELNSIYKLTKHNQIQNNNL